MDGGPLAYPLLEFCRNLWKVAFTIYMDALTADGLLRITVETLQHIDHIWVIERFVVDVKKEPALWNHEADTAVIALAAAAFASSKVTQVWRYSVICAGIPTESGHGIFWFATVLLNKVPT